MYGDDWALRPGETTQHRYFPNDGHHCGMIVRAADTRSAWLSIATLLDSTLRSLKGIPARRMHHREQFRLGWTGEQFAIPLADRAAEVPRMMEASS